jgi:hypothetical protein
MKNYLRGLLAVFFLALATSASANDRTRECQSKALFSKDIVTAKYAGATWQEVQTAVQYGMNRPEYAHLTKQDKAEVEVQAIISYHSKLSPEELFDDVMYKCLKGNNDT